MRTVDAIIQDLGGPAAIAKETTIPLTTVCSWVHVNFIPTWRQPAIQELGQRIGKPISDGDFPPRSSRRQRVRPSAVAA
jgi:hypothetical protein